MHRIVDVLKSHGGADGVTFGAAIPVSCECSPPLPLLIRLLISFSPKNYLLLLLRFI